MKATAKVKGDFVAANFGGLVDAENGPISRRILIEGTLRESPMSPTGGDSTKFP